MRAFADLADLPEDERITIIREVAASGNIVAVIVDDDAKADRYVRKLGATVRIIDRSPGPVKNTILVRIGPKES